MFQTFLIFPALDSIQYIFRFRYWHFYIWKFCLGLFIFSIFLNMFHILILTILVPLSVILLFLGLFPLVDLSPGHGSYFPVLLNIHDHFVLNVRHCESYIVVWWLLLHFLERVGPFSGVWLLEMRRTCGGRILRWFGQIQSSLSWGLNCGCAGVGPAGGPRFFKNFFLIYFIY